MIKTSRISLMKFFLLGLVTLLTACGGGGGDSGSSGPVVSTTSFPFSTANANLINNGYTHNYTLTGWQIVNGVQYNVTGSGTIAQSAAAASTFEGQAALLNTQTSTGTVTANGQSAPLPTTTVQQYSTSNYVPLGYVDSGEYCVMQGTPTIPATVKVGDTAVLGTYTCYANSSKTTVLGTSKMSYVIEADTANTAIINIKEEDYDASSTLTFTSQQRWRIDVNGGVSFVSVTAADTTYSYTMN
jgi:hypothetical protein